MRASTSALAEPTLSVSPGAGSLPSAPQPAGPPQAVPASAIPRSWRLHRAAEAAVTPAAQSRSAPSPAGSSASSLSADGSRSLVEPLARALRDTSITTSLQLRQLTEHT